MKNFQLLDTKDPDLKRLVDRDGEWKRYLHVPSGRYLDGVTTILSIGYPKGPGFEDWLVKNSEEEREAILSESSARGDQLHRLVDLLISGDQTVTIDRDTEVYAREAGEETRMTNRTWDNALTFARFWGLHLPVVIDSEKPVYSLEHGFAGTADAILTLTRACDVKSCPCEPLVGKPGVYDWKTSKKVYPDKFAQSAAYAKGENLPVMPEYAAVLALGSRAVLTGGYELKAAEGSALEKCWQQFLAAQRIADIRPFDPAKEIKEVPDSITIEITPNA